MGRDRLKEASETAAAKAKLRIEDAGGLGEVNRLLSDDDALSKSLYKLRAIYNNSNLDKKQVRARLRLDLKRAKEKGSSSIVGSVPLKTTEE